MANRDIPKQRLNMAGLRKSMRLFGFMKPADRWLLAVGTFFLAITAGTALLFPELLGNMVDSYSDINKLQKTATAFLYLFLAQAVFSFLRIGLYVRVAENLTAGLRNRLYQSVLQQNMDFFHQNRIGDLISRFTADIGQIQDTFTSNLAMFLRQFMVIIGGIAYLFFTSNTLSLYMLASVPVVVVISMFFGRFIRKIGKQVQELTGNNSVIAEETFTGIQSVKAFTNETFEMSRYGKDVEMLRKKSIYRGLLRGAFSSFIIVCLFGSIVWLIFMGLGMVRSGEMALGELISFMFFTGFVGGSIGGMAEQFVQIQKTLGAVERVLDLIDKPVETNEAPNLENTFSGGVRFEHVGFCYPGRPDYTVLEDVSFQIGAGKTLAIVGPSGAGKSTIINLMYRFYEPIKGNIYLGDKSIAEAHVYDLRRQLALVPQEIILFGGSIYDNILYGNPSADKEAVISSAKQANAHEFISAFPEGYETLVGDRGIKLSGGQRQRIAIARAILRNPQLLILDEATSSLDSESEELVQSALKTLMKDRTSIVIAHRLSTIRHADTILVLKQGRIIEQGSHEALMGLADGYYRSMVERQQDHTDFINHQENP
jgi:ABC-type multidrug transport system fused ATPase/permease subunit